MLYFIGESCVPADYIGLEMANESGKTRDRNYLLIIVVGATLIRALYLIFYSQMPQWDQLTVDNYYHLHWAMYLADGDWLGTTTYFRAPFYIYCLGLIYSLFGVGLWSARLFGTLIGVASVAMTYLIGLKMFGRKVGIASALLHMLFPVAIYFEAELLLDPLFTLLVQLSLYAWIVWEDHPESRRRALIPAIILGVAAITRPTALAFVPIFLYLLARRTDCARPAVIRSMIWYFAGLAIVILPVTARNMYVAGDLVLISSQGGINLFIGNNDEADGFSARLPEPYGYNWQIADITAEAERVEGQSLLPGDVSWYWTKKSLSWMTSHPLRSTQLYITKLAHLFGSSEVSNNRNLSRFFDLHPLLRYLRLPFGLILILSVMAVLVGYRSNRRVRLLGALIISYSLLLSVFFFSSRFRLPLMPLFFILAGYGLLCILSSRLWTRKQIAFRWGIAVLAGVATFSLHFPPSAKASAIEFTSSGLHHYWKQEYHVALDRFRRAVQSDPSLPDVNLNIGSCFVRLGEVDSARYYFERERNLHPLRRKSYINLASLELLAGRHSSASHLAQQALELGSYDATAHLVLLRAAAADSSLSSDSLESIARSAARQSRNDLYVVNEAAIVMSDRGLTFAAEQLIRRGLAAERPPVETDDGMFSTRWKNSPDNLLKQRAVAHYQLGYLLGFAGRFQESVDESNRAIDADSTLIDAYRNLVTGLRQLGQYARADSIAKKVRSLTGD